MRDTRACGKSEIFGHGLTQILKLTHLPTRSPLPVAALPSMSLLPAAALTDLRLWDLCFIRVDLWLHFWIRGFQIVTAFFLLCSLNRKTGNFFFLGRQVPLFLIQNILASWFPDSKE